MIRRPPRSTLFPTRRSSDLRRLSQRGSQQDGWENAGSTAHGDGRLGALASIHGRGLGRRGCGDRKSTRLNSSHLVISYAVFCLKKKISLFSRSSTTYHKPYT